MLDVVRVRDLRVVLHRFLCVRIRRAILWVWSYVALRDVCSMCVLYSCVEVFQRFIVVCYIGLVDCLDAQSMSAATASQPEFLCL